MAADEPTPLMKQYLELKSQAGDALLFFRMGDFYELFGDDAVEAAKLLEITLTSRDRNKPNPLPMAGVPHHSAQSYIQRLLKMGKKVAIGEQMEDPNTVTGKNIVRRELIRVLTPGIQFDVEGAEPQYLAALQPLARAGARAKNEPTRYALACLDASTGETLLGVLESADEATEELSRLPIRHLLLPQGDALSRAELAPRFPQLLIEEHATNATTIEQAEALLLKQFEVGALESLFPPGVEASLEAGRALGQTVAYALKSQRTDKLPHLRLPSPLHRPQTMTLGPRTAQHLDLVPGADGTPNLYALINRTRTATGARTLRRWMLAPLLGPAEIQARQQAVRALASAGRNGETLGTELAEVYDLERILGRVHTRLANPRDTLALGRSLQSLPKLATTLAAIAPVEGALLAHLRVRVTELGEKLGPLGSKIVSRQREEAPLVARDGGIFGRGFHPELDRLLSLSEDGSRWLVDLENREREATGIPSLKVRYNRVFGYYIEITQAHLKSAPAHYQRKQTTVGSERFFTEELKRFEDDILTASSKQKALEQELFNELLLEIQAVTRDVIGAADALGELDALLSLSRLAIEPGWVFPQVDNSRELSITQGRHPLVDGRARGSFVPNDLALSPETRMALMITGPNMGGKSTVMRQTALIVILGQLGAPVPAAAAYWGAVSSLHTRIGAHDAIARGQSTFMVEMSELAHILHHADDRSLIVLDEIGRGTSTYDGISVAWATLEWICRQIGCRTLFATHYHELTRLASSQPQAPGGAAVGTAHGLPRLANAHMAVEGAQSGSRVGGLRFLYELRDGAASESYGVHVARLAGLPKPVIARAWEVLEELERTADHAANLQRDGATDQLSLFSRPIEVPVAPIEHPQAQLMLDELEKIDLNAMTPLQALNWVAQQKDSINKHA